jgi:hypothetical protein
MKGGMMDALLDARPEDFCDDDCCGDDCCVA